MQNASTKLSALRRSSVLSEEKKERKKKEKEAEGEEEEKEESQFADRRLGNAYTKSHHSSLFLFFSPLIFPLVPLFFLLFPPFCRATRRPRIFPSTSPAPTTPNLLLDLDFHATYSFSELFAVRSRVIVSG